MQSSNHYANHLESRSEAFTDGIRVVVRARYSAEHSDPHRGSWFFLYTIRVSNESETTTQLMTRHWVITDATGKVQEVQGPGVVGKQPVLEPGQAFEYTSGCPLETPFGNMRGRYGMQREDGVEFYARIESFELGAPSALH